MAKILVTGAAGFIGFSVSRALLMRGDEVIGVDNLNPYYDVRLKQARLAQLTPNPRFAFREIDISDHARVLALKREFPAIEGVIHLAAQAGVRHSISDPHAYIDANVTGQVAMLELARQLEGLKQFVYASSSSVYGASTARYFSVQDSIQTPLSVYAATKGAGELLAYSYSHLFGIPVMGLRFFTVYGPWGRPDMAAFIFTRAILAGEPVKLFNRGEMWRDFTFIDDIVDGVIRALDRPDTGTPPCKVYNLGCAKSEKLTDFVALIENALGKKAQFQFEQLQPGDVSATSADIDDSRLALGFEPATPISVGIPKFVDWYRNFYGA